MIENEKIQLLVTQAVHWVETSVFTPGALFELAIVAVIFGLARMIAPRLEDRYLRVMERVPAPWHLRQILVNLRRSLMPILAFIMVFLVLMIASLPEVPLQTNVLKAVNNLTLAWVAIRLFVQFIRNQALRSTVATIVWGIAALSILGVLDDTTAALDAFGITIGALRLSALTVIKGVLALFVLLYVANFTSRLMESRVNRINGISNSSKVLIGKIIRVVLVTMALLIGITAAGIDLSLLAVFGGAVGLGVGFGLQKGISNLFSGMLLLLDESIRPGDIIELKDGSFGWVEHMGARYTEIVTRDNKSFLIPNEDFITQQVVNWSHGNTLIRLEVKFGVSYKSDPHKVREIAIAAAMKPERVVEDPAPVCHLVAFGDSSLDFTLRFWIKDAEKGITNMRGEVMLLLWDAFKENGISIPYPHREVFIHDGDAVLKGKGA